MEVAPLAEHTTTPTTVEGPAPGRRNYARWRAGSLTLVYVLMVLHVLHWLRAGKTLAPLELNEVMYTFELGIVTAGFLFMALAVVATAVFGRFFCSWGCHILALQDLCGWILRKMHIRPRMIRSRFLLWVPVLAVLYMFVWPQVARIREGRPLPDLRLATDAEGWASFITTDFWRNLPGPWIIILTFFFCGFMIVYVMGSRSFCRYGCPYGALFGLVDRVAPGRIRFDANLCVKCGTCTAGCTSGVRVHEELNRYGMVVDTACLKDLDCVHACPEQAISFGFGRPALTRVERSDTEVRKHFDFTVGEEIGMAIVFLANLLIFRGLYDAVPFLMTIGLSLIVAYLCVVLVRMARRDSVKMNRWPLKQQGRVLARGRVFAGSMALFIVFAGHSAFVHYHTYEGRRLLEQTHGAGASGAVAARAAEHLSIADRWGLIPMDRTSARLANLYERLGRWAEATPHLERGVRQHPDDPALRERLGTALAKQGRTIGARRAYQEALDLDPQRAETHYRLAGLSFGSGRAAHALPHLREAVRLRPDFVEAHYDLGALLVTNGDPEQGITHLHRAVALRPEFGDAHFNLAVALATTGKRDEAMAAVERALKIQPLDERTLALRQALVEQGR